jgi:NhaA family Na+:H+ antiporter
MDFIRQFTSTEKLGGLLLIIAAFTALALDNSPIAWIYDSLLTTPVIVQIGALELNKPLLLWINDGLMAIFFFLVGLEIKREVLGGELSSIKKATLPIVAALGGIVVPAGLFTLLNQGDALAMKGWAVPVATDIAFALGILALVGKGLPKELKILLLSLAIIDDIAAIVIIAIFYTQDLSVLALSLASIGAVGAVSLNVLGVKRIAPYILIGIFMWICVLKSGVHATLAGVVLAMCIPMTGKKDKCPVEEIEHALYPWVYFLIVPLFAFANSGINLQGFEIDMLTAGLPLGIIVGLLVGKQVGVFGFIWLGSLLKICQKPDTVSWAHIYGLSLLTGIGFTMSLFIGTLAYEDPDMMAQIRLGVLTASFFAAISGFVILKILAKPERKSTK